MATIFEAGKTALELRREREQRIDDAISLKRTDRVPVMCSLGYFVARQAGIRCSAAYYDADVWLEAYRKTLKDYQPDTAFTQLFTPGKALKYVKPRFGRWPGYGVNPNHGHQAIEVEGMQDNEYNLFLNKHADDMLRHPLPRTYEGLNELSICRRKPLRDPVSQDRIVRNEQSGSKHWKRNCCRRFLSSAEVIRKLENGLSWSDPMHHATRT